MKLKISVYVLFSFVLLSCNDDVKIITSKSNKECRRLATCFRLDRYSNESVGRETDSIRDGITYATPSIDEEQRRYSNSSNLMDIEDKRNIEFLSKTKTLAIKNFSKTKVYNVRIQRTYQDKVKFKDYKIEPTEEICIGCDADFDIDLNYIEKQIPNSYPNYGFHREIILPYEGKIKKAHKVEYKIHSVTLQSEY